MPQTSVHHTGEHSGVNAHDDQKQQSAIKYVLFTFLSFLHFFPSSSSGLLFGPDIGVMINILDFIMANQSYQPRSMRRQHHDIFWRYQQRLVIFSAEKSCFLSLPPVCHQLANLYVDRPAGQ